MNYIHCKYFDALLCTAPQVEHEELKQFYLFCLAENLSRARIIKYCELLKTLYRFCSPLLHLDRQGVMELVAEINSSEYSEHYKHDLKVALKKTYKVVLGGGDYYPKSVSWLKTSLPRGAGRLPSSLLSQEEMLMLIEGARNDLQRSFIAVLSESGCRVSELTSLRLDRLWFDKHGARILVSGKTGDRVIRLVNSVYYLKKWLLQHPRPVPGVFVWHSYKRKDKPLNKSSVNHFLKEIAHRVGVVKRVNPHSFRHARASALANFLTEAQMCAYFGWTQGSDMPQVYVHLSGRDIDRRMLEIADNFRIGGESELLALA